MCLRFGRRPQEVVGMEDIRKDMDDGRSQKERKREVDKMKEKLGGSMCERIVQICRRDCH